MPDTEKTELNHQLRCFTLLISLNRFFVNPYRLPGTDQSADSQWTSSIRQDGKTLGIPENTVKTRMRNARKQLGRTLLVEWGAEA